MDIKNENSIIFHGNEKLDEIVIHWLPTHFCNYQCSYCISHAPHTKVEMQFTNIKILKNVADKIFAMNKNKYTFIFSGGEPTIYPYFIELVEYITRHDNVYIYLYSNGHKNTNYFSSLFEIKNFFLNFSIHFEFFNIEHLKKIIKCSNNYKKYIMCSIMLNPNFKSEYINTYKELLEFRKNYFFGIDLALIHNNQKLDNRYTEEDINWFYNSRKEIKEIEEKYKYNGYIPDYDQDKNSIYIFNNNKNDKIHINHRESMAKNIKCFKGLYCCSGVNSIAIDSNGNYKGVECELAELIGNIHYEEIDYFKLLKPIQCSLEGCACRFNNYAPKYKYKDEAYKCIQQYIEKAVPKKYIYNKIVEQNSKLNELENKIYLLENNTSFQLNKIVNSIAWWIPIKKWRDNFRNKIFNTDQTRPDQTRPDQTRPDQTT